MSLIFNDRWSLRGSRAVQKKPCRAACKSLTFPVSYGNFDS